MAMIIHWITSTQDGVNPVDIIHIPVRIIILAVGRFIKPVGIESRFPRIDPHLIRQFLMLIIHPRINHGHKNGIGGECCVVGVRGQPTDIGTRSPRFRLMVAVMILLSGIIQ